MLLSFDSVFASQKALQHSLPWFSQRGDEGHTSNRGHWLSLTSWKCNICHDLPKWLPSPCSCRSLKGPFVLCRLRALQSDAPSELYASLPRHPVRFTTSSQIGAHLFFHAVLYARSWIPVAAPSPHGFDIRLRLQLQFAECFQWPQLLKKCLACGCKTCPVIIESKTYRSKGFSRIHLTNLTSQ